MDHIEKWFFNKVVKRVNMLLYDVKNSLKLVDICGKYGVKIYGFEMLKIYGYINSYNEAIGGIQPKMELSFEFNDGEISLLDRCNQIREEILKRAQMCDLGYLFDISYDRVKANSIYPNYREGKDHLYDDLTEISLYPNSEFKNLVFKFEKLEKVIGQCKDANLPIYGIYSVPLKEVDRMEMTCKRELKYDVYWGDKWLEIDTWEAALKHLEAIRDSVVDGEVGFEVNYQSYKGLH